MPSCATNTRRMRWLSGCESVRIKFESFENSCINILSHRLVTVTDCSAMGGVELFWQMRKSPPCLLYSPLSKTLLNSLDTIDVRLGLLERLADYDDNCLHSTGAHSKLRV